MSTSKVQLDETRRGSLGSLVIVARVACDTAAEADRAARALDGALLPRFTRDEAIAIVNAKFIDPIARTDEAMRDDWKSFAEGVRFALGALAAAGVFSDAPGGTGLRDVGRMADMLDAAGIR